MTGKKPERIVELFGASHSEAGGGMAPPIQPDTPENRLEELLKQANVLGPENNQAGNGRKNSDKATRAARRAKKLARKKNRYR